MLKRLDPWGGPETYPHMAAGWAVALNAPFGWMKQAPSDFGSTRNGMVVSWPKGIKAKNEMRTQFGHAIDVAPTVLQAIGLPEPKAVNGTPQIPMEGTRLLYSLDGAKAKERHTTEYFEIAGNRAICHDGWFARTIHRASWEAKPRHALQDDVWELYDVRSDFSLVNDVATKNPKKLAELQRHSIASSQPLTPGKHTIRFDFAYDGGGPATGGMGTLLVDGEKVAEGRIPVTQPGMFSADETADVGVDLGTPVVEAIGAEAKSRFTGRIPKVAIDVK